MGDPPEAPPSPGRDEHQPLRVRVTDQITAANPRKRSEATVTTSGPRWTRAIKTVTRRRPCGHQHREASEVPEPEGAVLGIHAAQRLGVSHATGT